MKYIVDAEFFEAIYEDYLVYQALDNGGVGAWEWCGESCSDFLATEGCEEFAELKDLDIKRMIKEGKIEVEF